MTESRPIQQVAQAGQRTDTICIDTHRVLDCCRDRDCYEDVRVYLDTYGQSIIDSNPTIRVVDAQNVWTNIGVSDVPFNNGFFQLDLRYFILLRCEACVGGGKSQNFWGICALDKKAVLWGGEGNVTIFKSTEESTFCRSNPGISTNRPIGVVETVPPIVLSEKIIDCNCYPGQYGCCNVGPAEFPESVTNLLEQPLIDPEGAHRLFVSLGLFSVIRLERPAQYLVQASDYSVPEKECVGQSEDTPCTLFRAMGFPVEEFTPAGLTVTDKTGTRCGCRNGN